MYNVLTDLHIMSKFTTRMTEFFTPVRDMKSLFLIGALSAALLSSFEMYLVRMVKGIADAIELKDATLFHKVLLSY